MGLEGSALAAAETIASRPGWVPLVLCGRSNDLYERIQQARGIRALPWVDDMPAVMSAADVLVDNAGGMSSKEALAIGLPVVTFRPISGHGRDDASSLARLGLTHVTEDEQHLVEVLEDLLRDPDAVRERVQRGRRLFVADAADLVEQASGPGAPLSAAASD
jgi:UDP-N-acetylglucosamine:LPS N-acetylglucosamine transferase